LGLFCSWLTTVNPVENKSRREGYNKRENKQRNQQAAARVASEDDSWFFRNGFQREILEAEESLGTSIKDNISCMCMYDILNVIVDYPYMIYAAGGEANVN
jgi:hypothetical protein